jgi:hypothetical protein
MFCIVLGLDFFAKSTGTFKIAPTIMAGAIPLASMVMTLLISCEENRLTSSSAIICIRAGSIWWFIKLSTFRIPPGKHFPSFKILSSRHFISILNLIFLFIPLPEGTKCIRTHEMFAFD